MTEEFSISYKLAQTVYGILESKYPNREEINFSLICSTVSNTSEVLTSLMGPVYTEPVQMEACRLVHQWMGTIGVSSGAIIDNGEVSDWPCHVESDWFYWLRYKKMLLEKKHWSQTVVESMDNDTSEILRRLGNPALPEFSKKGLVIGHVQAGKTANYTALLNKAVDVGYRVIIVIAGTLESLRSQTQKRIEHDMVGRSTGVVPVPGPYGVARYGYSEQHVPTLITNSQADFNKGDALQAGRYNPSQPLVLVIKKNVKVLKAVEAWFRERYSPAERANLPMLLIDDEADNATINTAKDPENTPTAINAAIRKLISKKLFLRCSYVGYTATPYANIFIDPESYDAAVQDDLFPRDFICCLSTPDSYMGAAKFFLRSRDGENEDGGERDLLPYVRTIPMEDTAEDSPLPVTHKRDFIFTDMPDSLKEAVMTFVIAKSIRLLRCEHHEHCGMLIHVSRFTDVQNTVADVVQSYFRRCQNEVDEYAASAYWADSKMVQEFKTVWEKQYEGCLDGDLVITWEMIRNVLSQAMDSVQFRCINASTPPDQRLNYELYPNGLTAIVVGGMSMARGITVEGLVCSYFVRNTKMYDTLMQMGRWFGHRQGYVDLCRVFMRRDTQEWFAHIAEATEELRASVMKMQEGGATPMEFGLRVRSDTSEARLLITAKNRMRSARLIYDKITFEGGLFETSKIPYQDGSLRMATNAMDAFVRLLLSKYGAPIPDPQRRGWIWRNVSRDIIIDYISSSSELKKTCTTAIYSEKALIDYVKKNDELFDVLLLSLTSLGAKTEKQRKQVCGIEIVMPYRNPYDYNKDKDYIQFRKSHFFSAKDEAAGLSDEAVKKLERINDQYTSLPGYMYRNVEGRKPLFMMSYALLLDSEYVDAERNRKDTEKIGYTPASHPEAYNTEASVFGISWTGEWKRDSLNKGVPYMVNRVYLDNLEEQFVNAENDNHDESDE